MRTKQTQPQWLMVMPWQNQSTGASTKPKLTSQYKSAGDTMPDISTPGYNKHLQTTDACSWTLPRPPLPKLSAPSRTIATRQLFIKEDWQATQAVTGRDMIQRSEQSKNLTRLLVASSLASEENATMMLSAARRAVTAAMLGSSGEFAQGFYRTGSRQSALVAGTLAHAGRQLAADADPWLTSTAKN
jgi:hypothetical protein